MVGRRYLCPVTGGEGGVGRLRGDLYLWRLGEALAAGRGERLRLAGVEVEFGTGVKGVIQVQPELRSGCSGCLLVVLRVQQQC